MFSSTSFQPSFSVECAGFTWKTRQRQPGHDHVRRCCKRNCPSEEADQGQHEEEALQAIPANGSAARLQGQPSPTICIDYSPMSSTRPASKPEACLQGQPSLTICIDCCPMSPTHPASESEACLDSCVPSVRSFTFIGQAVWPAYARQQDCIGLSCLSTGTTDTDAPCCACRVSALPLSTSRRTSVL